MGNACIFLLQVDHTVAVGIHLAQNVIEDHIGQGKIKLPEQDSNCAAVKRAGASSTAGAGSHRCVREELPREPDGRRRQRSAGR